jgi:polyphosphate kinase
MQSVVSVAIKKGDRLIERDLSWLQFNERVLHEAEELNNPLLERLRFLGISSGNLDEFFLIRFASRLRETALLSKNSAKHPAKLERALQVQESVMRGTHRFVVRQSGVFLEVQRELRQRGVVLGLGVAPSEEELAWAQRVFLERIVSEMPAPQFFSDELLTSMKNLQLAFIYRNDRVILLPKRLPAFHIVYPTKQTAYCFFTEELLSRFLGPIFGEQEPPVVIRIARDADVQVELESSDPEAIPDIVRKRIDTRERRPVVRIQVSMGAAAEVVQRCVLAFKSSEQQVMHVAHTLQLNSLIGVVNELQADGRFSKLYFPKFDSCLPRPFDRSSEILSGLDIRDYLFHHPYDSFEGYVNFVRAAVEDPTVDSIQQTVYRIDTLSEVVALLKKAAGVGKRVRVVIEPRARFDEIHNIQLAEELRSAGVEVIFATGPLKLHAKITCITKPRIDGTQAVYTHLSTGNYNAKTARLYTDLALFTANPKFGLDALTFFDSISEGEFPQGMRSLVLAPTGLHRRVESLIRSETKAAQRGQKARIFAKVNALVDPKIIESLYTASQAGVQVDLMVRGACSLIPGVPGMSERIKVFSIIDRFLEHSRIYYFESQKKAYLSSADWMPRNFFSRFEIAFPVLDPRLLKYVSEVIIPTYMKDRAKSKVLTSQGTWRRRSGHAESQDRAQFKFKELAQQEYKATPLEFELK